MQLAESDLEEAERFLNTISNHEANFMFAQALIEQNKPSELQRLLAAPTAVPATTAAPALCGNSSG
jgi:hypothetical protein